MSDRTKERLLDEMKHAESKAIDALSRYKFQMFGYWAGIWVHLNRLSGARQQQPVQRVRAPCARERGTSEIRVTAIETITQGRPCLGDPGIWQKFTKGETAMVITFKDSTSNIIYKVDTDTCVRVWKIDENIRSLTLYNTPMGNWIIIEDRVNGEYEIKGTGEGAAIEFLLEYAPPARLRLHAAELGVKFEDY